MVSLSTSPFSASSSWNKPVPGGSSFTKLNWPGSTGYNYGVAWDSYSPAVYVASASDPVVQVSHPAGWGYPAGTVGVHMPAGADGAAGTDGELVVIDGDVAYNFWQFNRTGTTTGTAASFGAENVVTGDGWGSKSPFLSAGITAVGASELGGLVVKAEADDGAIDHALQLVVDSKLVMPGFTGSAIAGDGSSGSGLVKEGQFLAISPGTPMPAGLSKLGQEVFTAMQKYGAYVVDVAGGTTNIRAQQNAFDNATITSLYHDMSKITPLLQGVNPGSGGTPVDPPSATTPPATTPPVTAPPVTTPPVTTPPVADATAPKLQWVAANGTGVTNGTGTVGAGDTVHLSLNFSEKVNVTGSPSLALNSKGTAKYVSGAGTDTLLFDYKVAAGQNASDLEISGFNLGGIKDSAGNSVNVAGAPHQPAGTLAVSTSLSPTDPTSPTNPTVPTNPTSPANTTAPKLQWVAASGHGLTKGTGTVGAGDTVHLSLNFGEKVNVTGSPSLALNSKGTAKYVSGSGTNTLLFDYKVAAGQSTTDLAITGFNLGGVKDLTGNGVNLAGAPRQPAGTLAIHAPLSSTNPTSSTDPTAPRLQWVAASGHGLTKGTGTVGAGDTVHLSLNFGEKVNVTDSPSLALNSKGTAKYVSGSGTETLLFDYKVAAGQNASDLEISGFNLGGIKDSAGKSVNPAGAPHQPAGTLAVRTTASAAVASAATSTEMPSVASTAPALAASGFGNHATTLGYKANTGTASGSSTAADDSRMALFNQHMASSFATPPGSAVGAPTQQHAWGGMSQTLARPTA